MTFRFTKPKADPDGSAFNLERVEGVERRTRVSTGRKRTHATDVVRFAERILQS
jgi:hypothetical protein